MLTMTRSDDTLILVSDDQFAENDWLREAIEAAAPQLMERFENTLPDDDGLLRFSVESEDWEALADVIEELSCLTSTVNPDEVAAIEDALQVALNS